MRLREKVIPLPWVGPTLVAATREQERDNPLLVPVMKSLQRLTD
jgi:hypothetical protein